MHGPALRNFPGREAILALCEQTGKYPFAFLSSSVFAIEETPTPWHSTKEPGDAYPALSIILSGTGNSFETEADLDTGAADCYGALRLLTHAGIVSIHSEDIERTSRHLGSPFVYFTIPVSVSLTGPNSAGQECQTAIVCVDSWNASPFTATNPARTFLLGRSVLMRLQPRLVLDFAARRTEVQSVKAAS